MSSILSKTIQVNIYSKLTPQKYYLCFNVSIENCGCTITIGAGTEKHWTHVHFK